MKKLVRKGVEVQHMIDGKTRYKPFAIFNESCNDAIDEYKTVFKNEKYYLAHAAFLTKTGQSWFADEKTAQEYLDAAIAFEIKEYKENTPLKIEIKEYE